MQGGRTKGHFVRHIPSKSASVRNKHYLPLFARKRVCGYLTYTWTRQHEVEEGPRTAQSHPRTTGQGLS